MFDQSKDPMLNAGNSLMHSIDFNLLDLGQ